MRSGDRTAWMRLGVVLLLVGVLVSGCTSAKSTKVDTGSTEATGGSPSTGSDDPLIAKVLKSAEATSAAFSGGEIAGYFVEYKLSHRRAVEGVNVVVLTDGSVRDIDYDNVPPGLFRSRGTLLTRQEMPPRLGPEPADAARTRADAVLKGQRVVAKYMPQMWRAQADVFGYLVRLDRVSGSATNFWVTPAGQPEALTPAADLVPWHHP